VALVNDTPLTIGGLVALPCRRSLPTRDCCSLIGFSLNMLRMSRTLVSKRLLLLRSHLAAFGLASDLDSAVALDLEAASPSPWDDHGRQGDHEDGGNDDGDDDCDAHCSSSALLLGFYPICGTSNSGGQVMSGAHHCLSSRWLG
jgi:hypothetical protein